MNEFFKRIMAGEKVPTSEVKEAQATMVVNRVRAFNASPCVKAGGVRGCPSKNCAHGLSNDEDIAFAAVLTQEAQEARERGD